jgi:hypothetical protein
MENVPVVSVSVVEFLASCAVITMVLSLWSGGQRTLGDHVKEMSVLGTALGPPVPLSAYADELTAPSSRATATIVSKNRATLLMIFMEVPPLPIVEFGKDPRSILSAHKPSSLTTLLSRGTTLWNSISWEMLVYQDFFFARS